MAKCIRCGKNCNDGETMCDECKAWFQQKTGGAIPGVKPKKEKKSHMTRGFSAQKSSSKNVEKERIKTDVSSETKNININPKVLGIGIVVIAAAAVIVGISFQRNGKGARSMETGEAYKNKDELTQSDVGEKSDVDTGNIDEKVSAWNQLYGNQINSYSDLDSIRSASMDGNTYYYLDNQLVEIDIDNDQETTEYSREYYFNDGILYYANIYKSSDTVNELYFNDDILIRWKDVDGVNHDGEYHSEAFNEWYDYQTEAYDLYYMHEKPGNEEEIHTYELVVEDITWTEAYQCCLNKGGYLVRINSDEEYNEIVSQIQKENKANIKFWIGGYRDNNEEYRWAYNENGEIKGGEDIINSDSNDLNYWLDGEPSFYDEASGVEENRMNLFYMESLNKWVWNDASDDILAVANYYAGTIGYICEYE